MKARITSKKGSPSLAAIGVKTVAIDHQTTPKPSTVFPPILSAHMPPTIYATEDVNNFSWREKYECLSHEFKFMG